MKLSEAVSLYIQMRDKKAQMKADFEASVAPLNEKMDKLEAKLLDVFNKTGMDSVKTEFGTAYATTRTTASVADREAFMEYVKANEEWALLEVRTSKTAVEQYRAANDNELPPGINLREERVVNIRRSA
jgi:phage host-nuclease inhibitor protein Gam